MKNFKARILWVLLLPLFVVGTLLLHSCGSSKETFTILSGSENQPLESIIKEFTSDKQYDINFVYKGSVDIMLELENNPSAYDAVWPASGIWITLGDKNKKVKYAQSIMTSPVVFGIKKSLAEKLGFVGKQVKVADILQAIRDKKLQFIMTSASQSNSGASAFFGFLYALLGNPEYISKEDLYKPELKKQIRELLGGINRSSGSSGWLKDLYLKGNYDAMVNYESLIIETNQELEKLGREPLYVVYPVDGLVIADSQLGYVSNGDAAKEDFFKGLQKFLLTDKVQNELLNLGRRTGFAGETNNAPATVFNPAWGIDTKKILSPIKLPSAEIIQEALELYQTAFRKPSLTVFCLDYSGSMKGEGNEQLTQAMGILLDQQEARRYLLQTSPDDITIVIPFTDTITTMWKVVGNDPTQLQTLLENIKSFTVGGGTDIYSPAMKGLYEIAKSDTGGHIPAVILMTDGESLDGATYIDLENYWNKLGKDIPVFSITFGEAKKEQLSAVADLTRADVFDGTKDLVTAFRKAKGYN